MPAGRCHPITYRGMKMGNDALFDAMAKLAYWLDLNNISQDGRRVTISCASETESIMINATLRSDALYHMTKDRGDRIFVCGIEVRFQGPS